MTGRLEGKVIVCTGGGSGIGRAAVGAFLDEGAAVGVLELAADKLVDFFPEAGDRVVAIEGDARDAADNERLVEAARQRWGRVDSLVTFVGIFDQYTRLGAVGGPAMRAAFSEVFETNVLSVLEAARSALPSLRSSRGNIVLTLSSSSFYPGRGGILYVASKFALRGVVTELAHELAPEVRVNGVAPGGTLGTDLRGASSLGSSGERLDDRPGRREALEARTPLALALRPDDHCGAYVYLVSDDSRGVTGEVLRVDGGLGVR